MFSQQKVLRLGIMLFGFNLTFQQIASVGWEAIVLDVLVIAFVLGLGIWMGIRLLRMPRELAILIAVGSAICGAAAVMATERVVRASERDVTVAVASVVVFGTLAMFCYPLIFPFATMDSGQFGIYIGSTVHEVAQAVAAGQTIGDEAAQNAVVVKLIRVMLLAPVVILLGSLFRPAGTENDISVKSIDFPWFVLGFVSVVGINSVAAFPEGLVMHLQTASQASLALAMAALGIKTRWSTAREAGVHSLLQSLALFVLLMVGGYALNVWLYR